MGQETLRRGGRGPPSVVSQYVPLHLPAIESTVEGQKDQFSSVTTTADIV